MDHHALPNGFMLSEYRIDKLLGEGGFGLTYLGFDTHLEKTVAIKEYYPADFAFRKDGTTVVAKSDASAKDYDWGLQAFLSEAKTLAKFTDPNIVQIFRFFEAHGTAYMVMEFCEGGNLKERLTPDQPMSEEEVKAFMIPIMNGLQLVHESEILHRDIKPENIMFRRNGTPVLIDFGAARQAIGAKSRSITTIVTPGFAPIEQYSSKAAVGPSSDIYSLAAVVYNCLTGQRPDDAMDRITVDELDKLGEQPNSSAFLKSIDKALSVHAEQRPQNLIDWYEAWQEKDEEGEDKVATESDRSIRKPADPTVVIPREEQTKEGKNSGGNNFRALPVIIIVFVLAGLGFGAYNFMGSPDPDIADTTGEQSVGEGNGDVSNVQETVAEEILPTSSSEESEAEALRQLVMDVQSELLRLGYDIGTADGVVGARTTAAVGYFQAATGTTVDGEIDEVLLSALQSTQNRPGLSPGDSIQDCDECPQLVVIPEGSFDMGSNSEGESERPLTSVSIRQPIAIGVYEVTFDEWGTCILEGGCSTRPYSEGWGRGTRPVMNVSWEDTQQYLDWLSNKTGESYRLPSEAEWEYAARAGTSTDYFWGTDVGSYRANCDGCGSEWDNEQTAPAGSFSPNNFGLYDVHGNVNEWVQDCWYDNHAGAPGNEAAREYSGCTDRVYKGGSWYSYAEFLRVSNRTPQAASEIRSWTGFRVVRDL